MSILSKQLAFVTLLALQPLSAALLPAALVLDQRCFGGLWTLDGYQREIESPNSELLILLEEAEGRGQEAEGGQGQQGKQGAQGETQNSKLSGVAAQRTTQNLKLPSASAQEESKTQNSKLSSLSAQSATQNSPHTPHPTPHTPILGLGCYWAILEEAHITMLAIDPAYQRQGLGQTLLYALMASAHARGLERATLEVRLSNEAARALYQKFDFCEAGRRQRYYPDDGEDALVLWRGGLQTPEFLERLHVWQQQACDRLHTAGWELAGDRDRSQRQAQGGRN